MKRLLLSVCLLALPINLLAGNGEIRKASRPVPNSYIVILKPALGSSVNAIAQELSTVHGGRLITSGNKTAIFKNAIQGFGIEMSEQQARSLAANPRVDFVEENAYVSVSGSQSFSDQDPHFNLDRIDQKWPVASSFRGYMWQTSGAGVHAYVLDFGIERNHIEFDNDNDPNTAQPAPRVRDGMNFSNDGIAASHPCNGFLSPEGNASHGTSVASVLAGKNVGVAKDAYLVPIKVGNCDGTSQLVWLCWGMDWIVGPDNPNPTPNYRVPLPGQPALPIGPAVVSISMFIDAANPWDVITPISSFEHTVNNVIGGGMAVFVSANNHANSNCTTSPARMAYGNAANFASTYHTISVGGTDEGPAGVQQDRLWRCANYGDCSGNDPGSNTGACVDLYAPAHNLKVANLTSYSGYRQSPNNSGTSYSAPAAAGAAARLLQTNPTMTPTQVWDAIRTRADSSPLPVNFDSDGVYANDRMLYISIAE